MTNLVSPPEDWKQLIEDNYKALDGRGYTGSGQDAVQRAIATLCYAFRIYASVNDGTITPAELAPPFNFGAEDHAYEVVIDKPYADRQVADGSWNLVLAALTTSTAANHRALQQHFGKKSPDPLTTDELEQAWNILHQLRNAFAHDPFRPTFVPSTGYRRTYTVASLGISCDFAALTGTEFKPHIFGGLDGYLALVSLCIRSI